MKAIAINGSPRRGGNTEILLKGVLNTLEAAGWSTQYRLIDGNPVHKLAKKPVVRKVEMKVDANEDFPF